MARSWDDLIARCGGAGAAGLFVRLAGAYAETGRHYHDLRHIAHVLDILREHGQEPCRLELLELAAWFHDVVYDPRARDNEERSAELAVQALSTLRLAAEDISRVAALIRMTCHHRAPPDDGDAQLLLDADLAILGAPAEQYNDYARAIRQEYAWVPDADYRAGRRTVLAGFLVRPAIFGTPQLHDLLEAPARRNLVLEIATLS